MKLLITGGGTGGHIFPALCVAEEFIASYRDSSVVFVGAEGGMEENLVPGRGFPLRKLKVKGIIGKSFSETLKNLLLLCLVFPSCVRVISDEKPDAVIGFGGYASGPVVFSAWLMNYITAIHEQNSIPGLTNKVLGKVVDRVFISFKDSAKYFKSRGVIETGMPVRKEILNVGSENIRNKKFTVLIIGGSQGARALNRIFIKLVDEIPWIKEKVAIIHQTGQRDKEEVENKYRNAGIDAEVYDFINDMHNIYPRVDLVVARAGASTLAELSALGKPSILIPFPYAAGNHQLLNAKKFSDAGAAELILESELTTEKIATTIKSIMDSPERQKMMGEKAKLIFKKDSARIIVNHIVEMIKERKRKIV
jgi:UDP-N-acetylglucosamine--N-acetylmuramyl-(pentapeptide) pyrophosphoryl-undecaprenol N-acetylglucosamine transferase